jgi:hypothetical protein
MPCGPVRAARVADALETETAQFQRIAALIWPNEPRVVVRALTRPADGGPALPLTVISNAVAPRSPDGVGATAFHDL